MGRSFAQFPPDWVSSDLLRFFAWYSFPKSSTERRADEPILEPAGTLELMNA